MQAPRGRHDPDFGRSQAGARQQLPSGTERAKRGGGMRPVPARHVVPEDLLEERWAVLVSSTSSHEGCRRSPQLCTSYTALEQAKGEAQGDGRGGMGGRAVPSQPGDVTAPGKLRL